VAEAAVGEVDGGAESKGMNHMRNQILLGSILSAAVVSVQMLTTPATAGAAEAAQAFKTPEEAVLALEAAVVTTNRAGMAALFGPDSQHLVNPDDVQGAAELAEFSEAFKESHRLVEDSAKRRTLEVGTGHWPFPIPLVQTAQGWQYDTASGLEELLNRRIGRNELDVLRVMRAYVQAQREYASRDRDGDSVLEFAQKIASTPGSMDGLYWDPDLNGEESPLGPLVAYAQEEGYRGRGVRKDGEPQPFHGYFFRILKSQGKHAPGGKYNYVINGNMIGGFAMVAWPAAYGDSGIMTFIVNQQGCVYQKDCGPKTEKISRSMKAYDPAPTWNRSRD